MTDAPLRSASILENLKKQLVAPIPTFEIDFLSIKDAVYKIISATPFDHTNQLCLTSPKEDKQSVYEGTGSLFNFETRQWLARESDFKYFNQTVAAGPIFELYQRLNMSFAPWKIGRIRIMKLEPKRCYSLHQDLDYRLHIAIETNPQCFLIFQPGGLAHIPADGRLYFTNTLHTHTAMNGGNQDRIHLVFSTYE